MILKIIRYVGNERDWWILDDIRKISRTNVGSVPFDKDFDALGVDICILDFYDSLHDKSDQQFRDVMKLICRLSNGDEFCVLFDTVAYLLNDNGKTIEKIVANYRQ